MVKGKGDTIHIPELANLTATSKSADSDVTLSNPTEDVTDISIDQHYHVAVKVEDMAAIQSQSDLRSEYTKKMGYALAKQLDTALLGVFSSWTTTDVGTYGVDVTDATLVAGILALDEGDVPDNNRYFVVKPSQKAALMKLDKFTAASYLGEMTQKSPIQTGPNNSRLWGDVYGIPVYYTNQITTTSATPTQTHNILFQKEAIALAMQLSPRTQAAPWLESLATLVVADTIYGYSVLRTDFGVEVRS